MSPLFDTPITTDDRSLERVLSTGLPVALVFLDGPTPTMLDQTMERLARQNAGKLLLVKIRASENPAASRRYKLEHAPAVYTVKDGQVMSQAQQVSASDLEKHVAYLLGSGPLPPAAPPRSPGGASRPASARPAGSNGHSATERPVNVTDATYEWEVLHSPVPVLVDFWAPWCGPCRMTEPILEKLAREYSGRLKVAKMNVDENPLIPQQHGVQGIPTMLVVKNGQVAAKWVGALPEPALRSRIAPFVG